MPDPTNHSEEPTPTPYAGISPARQRPSSVGTVAAIAIGMGALGTVCCGLRGLVQASLVFANGGSVPAEDGTTHLVDPLVLRLNLVFGSLDLLTSSMLLICGIGALSLKGWARRIGLVVSVAIILTAVGSFVATVSYSGPRTEALNEELEKIHANQQEKTAATQPATRPAEEGQPIAKFWSFKTLAAGV